MIRIPPIPASANVFKGAVEFDEPYLPTTGGYFHLNLETPEYFWFCWIEKKARELIFGWQESPDQKYSYVRTLLAEAVERYLPNLKVYNLLFAHWGEHYGDMDPYCDGPAVENELVLIREAASRAAKAIERQDDHPAQQQENDAGKNGAFVVLHPDDLKILQALVKSRTTLLQSALEAETSLSRGTIGERLKFLREIGFVVRPNGERGGEAITEQGKAALGRRGA